MISRLLSPKCVAFIMILALLALLAVTGCKTTDASEHSNERYPAFGRLAESQEVVTGIAVRGDGGDLWIEFSNYPPLAHHFLSELDEIDVDLRSDEAEQLRLNKRVPENVIFCRARMRITENLASTIYDGALLCQPPDDIFTVRMTRSEAMPARGHGETNDWSWQLCLTFGATEQEFSDWCFDTFGDETLIDQLIWPDG